MAVSITILPPKCCYFLTKIHGVTAQNTVGLIFIMTAPNNLKCHSKLWCCDAERGRIDMEMEVVGFSIVFNICL